jgi:hypothetical protein
MVTLEEISVALEHPFVLLVIGALISGVLVAWLTNRWQNHRKELEIRVDIVSKIIKVVGSAAAKILGSIRREKPVSNIDGVLEKFTVDAITVSSMLQSYFSSEAKITTL